MSAFHLYTLRCADQSLYVGVTAELDSRVDVHNSGRGSAHTAKRRPVSLVYSEPHPTLSAARKREIQIKRWSRGKKEALIAGDVKQLHELSRRRTR
ncbi:MAG: GIY-YIG nuclease family protein [Phycisphaerales bacterium]|nr:GIY-YIG nuclease family protein [Phycisphaerales bacterium]